MSIEDLVVYRKTEELLNKVYPRLVKYPKSEKFSLCQHIKENFFELLKYISLGNSVKYVVRYMDDVIIVVENRDKAREINSLVSSFVRQELKLVCNEDKTKIFPINQGVNAIGYNIYATYMLLRNDSKKKIKRKIRAMPHLILEGRLPIEKAEQMLNSWKGHAEHGYSYNFIQSLLKRFKFIYLVKKKNGKTAFKINVAKLKKEGDEHVVLQKREVACM